MLVSFLLDVEYALLYNLVLILFGLIAVSKAKKGKKAKRWLVIGAVLQGISVLGRLLSMAGDPQQLTRYSVLSITLYVLFIACFAWMIRKQKTA